MNTAITNINKWTAKTAEAVRHICMKENKPCVGFSLVFAHTEDGYSTIWSFKPYLAFDPHNPPSEEDQEMLTQALEFLSEGIKKIMGGDIQELTIGASLKEMH